MEDGVTELDRRRFLKGAGALFVGTVATPVLAPVPAEAKVGRTIEVTHGVAAGDVTHDGAVIWCRGSGEGTMQVLYGTQAGSVALGRSRRTRVLRLRPEQDFIGQVALTRLEPGRRYHYRVELRQRGERAASVTGSFTAAPPPDEVTDVAFAWGGDTGQGMANRPPFPAFASIAAEAPAFFIFNGDTIYSDSTTPVGGAAKTLPEYRAKYKENRVDPYLQQLLASTPVIVGWDDHEVTNDFRGPEEPLMPVGNQAFHDYWPLSVGPERIYRSLRWGRAVEVFVLDTRQYADPLEAPDGPGKSLLGQEQRAWVAKGVAESDAIWKVLVTSSPLSIIRSDDPHQDDWVSYEYELGSLLEGWRGAGVRNLVWLTADVHWAQSISYPDWGMWEFVGCPIGANPRREPRPLSPTFGPTETFLGLNQRYYGTVRVNASSRAMTVDLKLEDGTLMHREVISAT